MNQELKDKGVFKIYVEALALVCFIALAYGSLLLIAKVYGA
jgi:hypothetical protein